MRAHQAEGLVWEFARPTASPSRGGLGQWTDNLRICSSGSPHNLFVPRSVPNRSKCALSALVLVRCCVCCKRTLKPGHFCQSSHNHCSPSANGTFGGQGWALVQWT
eukprot:4766246-Amphidinium_carterae.1